MIYSPPKRCYFVGLFLVTCLFFSIVTLVAIHLNEISLLNRSLILRSSAMCSAFGMLGSSIATIRKYYQTLITESVSTVNGKPINQSSWEYGWIFYYLMRPVLGSVLGGLVYILTLIGFRILSTSITPIISSQGHMMIYAISLLAGYAVSNVLDRLSAVAAQVFDSKVDAGSN